MNRYFDLADMLFGIIIFFLFILSNYAGHQAIKDNAKEQFDVMKVNFQNAAYAQSLMFAEVNKLLEQNQYLLTQLTVTRTNAEVTITVAKVDTLRRENKLLRQEIDTLKKRAKK